MDFMNPKNGWEEGGHFFYLRWFLWWLFFGRKWYLFGCFLLGEILEMVLGCFLDLASLFRLEGNESRIDHHPCHRCDP